MLDRSNLRYCLAASGLLLLILSVSTTGKIIYVDDDAAGANDGSSWTDAYNYLQDALADANSAEKPVEIRVAQGIYKPDHGAGITQGYPIVSFKLINGVTVLGGFAGIGATDPNARYIEEYKTVLSGDLAGDDANIEDPKELSAHPSRADNSYSVVSVRDTDETAVLDGVTITACVTCTHGYGSPSVANCTFTNARGGIENLSDNYRLNNCTFKGLWGDAIFDSGDTYTLTLTDCLFVDNGVGIQSGYRGDLTLRNCTFVGDGTEESRGAIDFGGDSLKLYNCKFMNIVADSVVRVHFRINTEGEFIAENCVFVGNIGRSIEKWQGRMVISNCLFAGNRRCAIQLLSENATIEGCTFSDNSTDQGCSAIDALHGAKVSNCIFWGNSSPAIENQREEIVMNYSNIEGGWPGEGNIDVDPCFVSPGYWDLNGTPEDPNDDLWINGDYHLCSQAGHWDQQSQTWVQDDVTSPCIDAGDPNSPIGTEPFPNGGRVNMGAYAAGDKASKSYFGEPVCETIIAGDINGDCIVDFEDLMILVSHWTMPIVEPVVEPPKVWLTEPQDGDRIAWPGPTTFRAEVSDDIKDEVEKVVFNMQITIGTRKIGRGLVERDGTNGWERVYTWSGDITEGTWTVWVVAKNNEGSVISVSPEITVTLYRP